MLAAIVAAALATASLGYAASNILNLGNPTNAKSTSPYFPLSGFKHVQLQLRSHGLPELLWIGTSWPGDAVSASERWPVVKALEQFGTFSGMRVQPQQCTAVAKSTGHATFCSIATFNWTNARYSSRYLAFTHRDLIDAEGRLYQRLSPTERDLYDRYVRQQRGTSVQAVGASITNFAHPSGRPAHAFPLIAVTGYAQTVSQMPLVSDLGTVAIAEPPGAATTHGLPDALYEQYLTFAQTQTALATGKSPPGSATLVADVNGEANVITALICHVDGGKPAKVCRRGVIRDLLRHVK